MTDGANGVRGVRGIGRSGGAVTGPAEDRSASRPVAVSDRAKRMVAIARAKGLVSGPKTVTVRGRMAAALVEEAKRRTGIASDTELLEAALATLAVADDYGEWLVAQRGTVDPGLDLEV